LRVLRAITPLLLGLAACSAPEEEGILGSAEPLYSQYHEEVIARDFFGDRREGVFLDVGAAHFKVHSTTYYLEKHLGWSGIAVDALPYANGYEKHRPRTKFFQYIVTDHSGSVESFYVLARLVYMSSHSKEYVDDVAQSEDDEYKQVEVSTITLNELLEQNGIAKIDFLSMDIEGGEPAALKGFDIERYRPELICIEGQTNRKQLLDYFSRHRYEKIERYSRYDNGLNWYLTPQSGGTHPARAIN
jgi:FkbM family methyltransferase